jgi:hypothetical protein
MNAKNQFGFLRSQQSHNEDIFFRVIILHSLARLHIIEIYASLAFEKKHRESAAVFLPLWNKFSK